MFGITVTRLDQISEEEKLRYQSLYCGLCRALKERYGQISRAALTYELTFLVMLYDSLYEPPENTGQDRCITHPKKKMPYTTSIYSDHAADLSVAFAYHKCLDDVADEGSVKSKVATAALAPAYKKAKERIGKQCHIIESCMNRIRNIESDESSGPDDAANVFGEMLGQIMVVHDDIWADTLQSFGSALGRFVYLMDAAVDLQDDKKTGSYNPFANLDIPIDQLRMLLMNIIGTATCEFEKLPLIKDVNIMRCILYSGVWQKFNHEYNITEAQQPTLRIAENEAGTDVS